MSAGQGEDVSEVPSDLVCAGCGYALRGLGEGGVCPECGKGIDESLAAWRAPAIEDWRARGIRRGCTMYCTGIVVMLASMHAGLVVGLAWRESAGLWLIGLGVLAGHIANFKGWVRMAEVFAGSTERELPRYEHDASLRLLSLVLWASVIVMGATSNAEGAWCILLVSGVVHAASVSRSDVVLQHLIGRLDPHRVSSRARPLRDAGVILGVGIALPAALAATLQSGQLIALAGPTIPGLLVARQAARCGAAARWMLARG